MTNTLPSRKLYLDNLRTLTVLLLFPYHTCMIYNDFGERFYIHGTDHAAATLFIGFGWGWMMPLLFAMAGISAAYALIRRSTKEFAKERVQKLLIPLIAGILLLVPVQSYIAGLSIDGNTGYLDSFTKLTDLTGYDGAFTPGQLWFILYLFIISLVCLPLMALLKRHSKETPAGKLPFIVLILLGIVPLLTHMILNISGKSFGEYITYFLFGYLILSSEDVLAKLDRYRFWLLGLMLCGYAVVLLTEHMFQEFFSWISILAILGLGRHDLNFENKWSRWLSKSSFGLYLFHQSWIVIVAHFVLPMTDSTAWQVSLILTGSILLTFLTYAGAKRVGLFRWMFGLKP